MPSGSSKLGDMWGILKATCDGQKKCTREATQKQKIPGTQKMFCACGGKHLYYGRLSHEKISGLVLEAVFPDALTPPANAHERSSE